MNCLNESTKEFKDLQRETGINKDKLKAIINTIQIADGVDSFPSAKLIKDYVSKNSSVRVSYLDKALSNTNIDKRSVDGSIYTISPGAYEFLVKENIPESAMELMEKKNLKVSEAETLKAYSSDSRKIGDILNDFKKFRFVGIDPDIVDMLVSKFEKNEDLFNRKMYFIQTGQSQNDVKTHGAYINGSVFINTSSELYNNVLFRPSLYMHEILHALTEDALGKNPEMREALSEYIVQLKNANKEVLENLKIDANNSIYEDIMNAIANNDPSEFIAEFYSSAGFRNFLKTMNGTGRNKLISIFKSIINLISEFVFGHPIGTDAFTETSEILERVLNLAANETVDRLVLDIDINQVAKGKRTWGATRDAEEFKANLKLSDEQGTFTAEGGAHDYSKNGEPYTSVTTEMKRRGISREYTNKAPDLLHNNFQSNFGSCVHSLMSIWAMANEKNIPIDKVDKSQLRDLVEPKNGEAGWAEGVKEQIYEIFDNAFGHMTVLGTEGKLFSNRGKKLAGSYDIKLMDDNGVTYTIDLKTMVKSHEDSNGVQIIDNKGFSNYKSSYGGNLSKESEHAVQLFTYRRLDLQNNTQTDIYGTLLLEISSIELEDGSYQITDVALSGPSASEKNAYGIVQLTETPSVHEMVMTVTDEADLSSKPELSSIIVNGVKMEVMDVINELFPDIDFNKKVQLSFMEIRQAADVKYRETGDKKYLQYSNGLSDLLEYDKSDVAVRNINKSIDRMHKSILTARSMMSKLNFRASASDFSRRGYDLSSRQSHYDVLNSYSLEEIASQIRIILDDISRIEKEALHSKMSDMDFLTEVNKLIIKLEAYKDIDDIIGFIDGDTRLTKSVNDFYLQLSSDTTEQNKKRFLDATDSLKSASADMIGLQTRLKDLRANRFAVMLANNGFDYENFKRNEFRVDFGKEWIKKNPGKDAQKDPNFKKELDSYVSNKMADIIKSGDFQRKSIEWYKTQMETASYDNSYIAAFLQAIQDNPDPIVTAAILRYKEVLLQKDHEHREFVIELEKLREALYKAKGYNSLTDPKDIYSFMILFPEPYDKKTTTTKFWKRSANNTQATLVRTPEQYYRDALREKKKEWYNSGLEQDEVLDRIQQWTETYAPISPEDLIRVKEELLALYTQKYNNGEISKRDLDELINIESSTNSHFKYLYEFLKSGKISDKAVEILDEIRADMYLSARRLSPDMYSDKYNKIMNLDGVIKEERDLYEFIVDHVDFLDASMPIEKRLNANLPGITKQKTEAFLLGDWDNYFRLLKEDLTLKLNKSAGFHQYGNVQKTTDMKGNILEEIPVYYLTGVDEKEQSYDIPKIFSMWHYQANSYLHTVSVLPYLEYTREVLEGREVAQRDSRGSLIVNKVMASLGERISPKSAVKSRRNNTAAQYSGWMGMEIYRSNEISGNETIQALFSNISWLVSMRGLGLNIPAQISNAIQGAVQNAYKLAGGKHVNLKNFKKATSEYLKNSVSTIADWNSVEQKALPNLISEYFGILPEERIVSSMNNNRFMRQFAQNPWGPALSGFTVGEHANQMVFAIAYLMGVDAYDKSGNNIGSLYSMMSKKDGVSGLSIDDRVSKVNIEGRMMNWKDGSARTLISSKLDFFMRRMHQNNKSESKVLLDANIYTKPFLAFRRWIAGTMEHMYGQWNVSPLEPRYTGYADMYKIGRVTSFKNFIWNRWRAKSMAQIDAMGWIKNEQKNAQWKQAIADIELRSSSAFMTDEDRANIRETYAAIGIAAVSTALTLGLTAALKRERKRRKHYSQNPERDRIGNLSFILYIAERARMEQMFYVNPRDLFNIFRSPAPAFDLIDTYVDWAIHAFSPWSWGDVYQGGKLHGKNRLLHKTLKALPFASQVYGLQYMDDKLRSMGID